MTLLLDTSALIYWTLLPSKLSSAAQAAIDASNRILISSISIWEVGIKAQKGQLVLPGAVQQFTFMLQQSYSVEFVAVDEKIWLKNLELVWDHRDPADRIIVATAILLHCPLVTSDLQIREFYPQSVW